MTCHSCRQKHNENSRIHLRGAYVYCVGCLPTNNAPHGIFAALKCFGSWLFGMQ